MIGLKEAIFRLPAAYRLAALRGFERFFKYGACRHVDGPFDQTGLGVWGGRTATLYVLHAGDFRYDLHFVWCAGGGCELVIGHITYGGRDLWLT